MTTTQTQDTKQKEFQPNQHVFYIKEKVKAVVKGYESVDKILISFYPHGKDKRISKLVHPKYLTEWKSLEDRKTNSPQIKSEKYRNKDNRYFHQVKQFHLAFGQPAPNTPTRITEERKLSRTKWMQEELDEFSAAKTIYDEVDGLVDLLYFSIGTLVEMGIKPDPIVDIVNQANMSKIFPDGKPHFREGDFKILKPSNWVAPEKLIEAEIDRQIKFAKVKNT